MKFGEIPTLARNGNLVISETSPISSDSSFFLGGRLLKFSILFFFIFLSTALADDSVVIAPEILVNGKRLRGDHRSARVYTEADLARESGRTIGEILRESAGVDFMVGTGGNSNLLIRGSSGSETLVIIDGVKANDPSATNRYFDWSRIDVSQIERVEILKGPQAVSYGSDAIGGVVLITTKRALPRPGAPATMASLEAGSESFVRARGSVGSDLGSAFGGEHEVSFQALGKGLFDGGSSALSPIGGSVEGDNSREASAGIALRSRWGRDTHSSLTADLRAAQEDIDAGPFQDDPNAIARNREIRAAANIDGKFLGGAEWGALTSYLDFRRAYVGSPDFRGSNFRGEFHIHSEVDSSIEWTTGVEGTRESVYSNLHDDTVAVFAESAVPIGREKITSLDFGTRYSHFTSYGNQWSGKAGVSVKPRETLEMDAGISTGFKAPSLYSLYDPTYGNPALKPEESVQVEAGIQFRPTGGNLVSLRGFESRIQNRFGFDPTTFRSLNVERAEIRGIEVEGETRVARSLRVGPSLIYLSTKDLRTGTDLPDVPRWKGALKFSFDFTSTDSVTLSLIGKSSRGSSVAGGQVAGFYRADLTSRHRLSQSFSLTTRFENLFNRDYQEVRGYRTPGFSAYLGVEFASL